jgi:prepilin-type N-terminal cleavage/methylation domain-containing protein
MKKKRLLRNEEGFTLIEIIAVLVILGILAAVAVPKFFDLQARAKEKAVASAVAELKVRVNQHFASDLLDGITPPNIGYTAASVGTNVGADFNITDWTPQTTDVTFNVIYPVGAGAETYARSLVMPTTD